jgi:hypothetical protein
MSKNCETQKQPDSATAGNFAAVISLSESGGLGIYIVRHVLKFGLQKWCTARYKKQIV